MPEHACPSTRDAARDGSEDPSLAPGEAWFQTRDGRRYGWEIGVVIVVKVALLVLLWFVFIRPWSRPIAPPGTIMQHLYLPAAPVSRDD